MGGGGEGGGRCMCPLVPAKETCSFPSYQNGHNYYKASKHQSTDSIAGSIVSEYRLRKWS